VEVEREEGNDVARTFAGGNHVVNLFSLQRREAQVRDGPRVAMARQRHVLTRSGGIAHADVERIDISNGVREEGVFRIECWAFERRTLDAGKSSDRSDGN
jgi:hypothetical protein